MACVFIMHPHDIYIIRMEYPSRASFPTAAALIYSTCHKLRPIYQQSLPTKSKPKTSLMCCRRHQSITSTRAVLLTPIMWCEQGQTLFCSACVFNHYYRLAFNQLLML